MAGLGQQLQRFRSLLVERRQRQRAQDVERQRDDSSTPQDVTSVRAKSQRHKKSTADKWNQ